MEGLQTPSIVTWDFVYLRLFGDRRLAEDQFGRIQIGMTEEIKRWGQIQRDKKKWKGCKRRNTNSQ